MKPISGETLLSALQWRYAVKKFDATKKIPANQWKELEEILVLTASSYGLQPWKFLVVENAEVRKKLRPASWGQSQVEDASHFVVFTSLKKLDEAFVDKYVQSVVHVRQAPADSMAAYRKMMVDNLVKGPQSAVIHTWTQKQTYIAMGNLLTAAALMGIDSTPMEGLDPAKYDEILGLNGTQYSTVMAMALGYRAADDGFQNLKKVRFPQAEVITHV